MLNVSNSKYIQDKSQSPDAFGYIKPFPGQLAVTTMIYNPVRYKSRHRLYNGFAKHVEDSGAKLFTCEVQFGGREFEVTEAGNPYHLQLRTDNELWLKENALNLMISRVPLDFNYIAWIDADVTFARPDWAQETIQQLQHYEVVQMFSNSIDLGPNEEPVDQSYGWIESIRRKSPFKGTKPDVPPKPDSGPVDGIVGKGWVKGAWHSGLAWAARRKTFDKFGGLIDNAILGSADRNMAAGLFGNIMDTVDSSFHPEYKQVMQDWQDRCERHVRRNVGQVPGTIFHHWHGRKCHRFYTERWKILKEFQFNPRTDLKRDHQGLWQLEDDHTLRFIGLRDAIREYFRMRNEDTIEV